MLVKWNLIYLFFAALFGFLFFPGTHLFFFAPFLIVCFYKKPFYHCLWIAALTGLMIDLFTAQVFGVTTVAYTVSTYILYRQNRNFFQDKISTLFIMTTLFSFATSIIQYLFYFLLDQRPTLSLTFLITDFLIMPLINGSFAFVFFSLPYQLYQRYYIKKVNE